MLRKKLITLTIICIAKSSLAAFFSPLGMISTPVCDAIASQAGINKPTTSIFATLALHPAPGSGICRAHQFLFNEIVHIIEEHEESMLVAASNLLYAPQDTMRKPQHTFWIEKKHIRQLSSLDDLGIPLSALPAPLGEHFSPTLHTHFKALARQMIVTLVLPWHTAIGSFSAGTRFVAIPEFEENDHYMVLVLNPTLMQLCKMPLTKNLALQERTRTITEARLEFIKVLHAWTSLEGIIPYVWGGSSFITPYDDAPAEEIMQENETILYLRPKTTHPWCGYDCSELILRAAQICSIPYYIKTSSLIERYLAPLQQGDSLESGDIIWYPGHVMVVDNLEENTCIEARGYEGGYGKVHRIKIGKIFDSISSYSQLYEKYRTNQPITILHENGMRLRTTSFKLLSLASVWLASLQEELLNTHIRLQPHSPLLKPTSMVN